MLSMENEELRIAAQWQRIQKAQLLLASLVEPERSLSDELIAKRREAAKDE